VVLGFFVSMYSLALCAGKGAKKKFADKTKRRSAAIPMQTRERNFDPA
jgi:hypothetical protein